MCQGEEHLAYQREGDREILAGQEVMLSLVECMGLLRSVPVGRLVYTENALPAVRPMTFAAPAGEVVIPTGNDMWFDRFGGGVLAFETGTIDPVTRTGWSVVAMGRSRLLSGAGGLPGFDDPGRSPWQHRCGDSYLVIDIEYVTGRHTRLVRPHGDYR